MFNVRLGEHSPRVTLLQVVLNSHGCAGADGKRLTVDGAYGRNTRAAVVAASKMIGVGDTSGGAATAALIQRLLADVDLSVITSVDLGDPKLQADVDEFRRNFDDPILLGGMCNGLAQLVLAVQSRAQPGRVAALRLDGHGNLGEWLTVSVGDVVHLREGNRAGRQEYAVIAEEIYSYVSAKNFDKVNGMIQPLSLIFAPFGFAEHLGCTLGARPQTRTMLGKLASLWGVPIRVGIQTQPIGSVMDIHGPAFTAFPRGHSLASWSRQFQTLDLPGVSR
ncbi:peptidoglycan-binding domain-containing protein [Labrys okinawensis]|uniref:peptidoglycan-binding domain-containing protein n=1 Tax=Labrys okinawensis TaxID=346911 RepID=UPI0039BD40FB